MGMMVVFWWGFHLPPVIRTIVLSVDIVAVLLEKRLARFKDLADQLMAGLDCEMLLFDEIF
jgi:hypothetical protein